MEMLGSLALGLGADLRAYVESFRHEGFGTGLPSNDYLQTRALLHGDLRRLLRRQSGQAAGRWLLISLKPGSAEAEPEALLEECSDLLAKAGLTP